MPTAADGSLTCAELMILRPRFNQKKEPRAELLMLPGGAAAG